MNSLPLRDAPLPRSLVARFREEVLFFVRQPGTIFKGSAEFYCVRCVITVEADWTTRAVQVRWQDMFTVNLRWLSSSSLSSFPCFRSELQVVVIASCEHAIQEKICLVLESREENPPFYHDGAKITSLFSVNVIESLIYLNFFFLPSWMKLHVLISFRGVRFLGHTVNINSTAHQVASGSLNASI